MTQKAYGSVVPEVVAVVLLVQHNEHTLYDVARYSFCVPESQINFTILKSSSLAVGENLYASIGILSAPGVLLSLCPLRQLRSSSSSRWSSSHIVVSS